MAFRNCSLGPSNLLRDAFSTSREIRDYFIKQNTVKVDHSPLHELLLEKEICIKCVQSQGMNRRDKELKDGWPAS